MARPNGSATCGHLVALGTMQGADPVAQDVIEFFLTEGYMDLLELAPSGKASVLESAVAGWSALSDYSVYYPEGPMAQISGGYDVMQRWLFRPDCDATQPAVIGDIEARLLFPRPSAARTNGYLKVFGAFHT